MVQLYVAETVGRQSSWNYILTGVACLAKDSNRRSYFIQVFDMDQNQLAWEQEVYREFQFKKGKPDVFIFEADDAMAALLFADVNEAKHFQKAVQLRLSKLRQKPKTVVNVPTNLAPPASLMHNVNLTGKSGGGQAAKSPKMNRSPAAGGKSKKKTKGKLTLDDIGAPTNFMHIQGSKLEAGGEMQMVNNLTEIEPGMRQIFQMAGLPQSMIHDPQKRSEITAFVKQNEKTLRKMSRKPPMNQHNSQKPKPRKPMMSKLDELPPPPPPPPVLSGPPPPPPPPAPPAPPPPTPQVGLKPGVPMKAKPQPVPDSRRGLLDGIEQFKKGQLKPVDETEAKRSSASHDDGSLTSALEKAIKMHESAMNYSSSDSEDEDEEDDEDVWSD